MELIREKEVVNQYHFDVRNFAWEEKNGEPKTNVEVNFHLIEKNEETKVTSMVATVKFMVVFKDFVISGGISQVNHVQGRLVEQPSEFTQEEVKYISTPILDMLNRLTYEVTEIALDAPGINLEF